MGRGFTIASTAVVTAILASAFWIFAYNIASAPTGSNGSVSASGDIATVDRAGSPTVAIAEGVQVGPAGLALPVVGIKPRELVDTFSQARAGGARVHDAIDIMAPVGRPGVAAAPGRVEKIFFSQGGGNSVYMRSDDGRWIYYYAHLSAYAPGLYRGQHLLRGAPVGFVGFSGNANPAGPHLHFAIHRMSAGEKWYQGRAINPYPLLAGRRASG